MNILYLSSKKRWGGVSSWMEKTALGLDRFGHKVWIVAHPDGKFANACSNRLSLVRKKLGMDYNPLMIWWIAQFIKAKSIDLIVTNIEKEVAIGGLAARLVGIPNIRRVGREDDFNQRLKVRLNHNLLVDYCIVPCNYVRDRALKRAPWLNPNQFKTVYNGRDIAVVGSSVVEDLRRHWGITNGQVVVGVTAQLSKQKRIDLLIEAFAEVMKKTSNAFLVVTGEGHEREGLERLATRLGIERKVVFNGFTHNPLAVASAYDIAVSSSSIEGFPNNVVEYFSVGRPVVTTNAGGVSEMAKNGHNALVVDVDNRAELAEAIYRLIVNRNLRRKLAKNALDTLDEAFSEEQMVRELNAYFMGILKKRLPSKNIFRY